MVLRSGTASLPLHQGKVPDWLWRRMADLGAAVVEAVLIAEGRSGFLSRLSDPFWFQCFGAVLGMDWHSSGVTTSVMGALKSGLSPRSRELGIHVLGGRGRHSRRTPEELLRLGDRTGLDARALVRTSRLVAKVDNTAILDGFSLYLHAFVVTDDGDWVVVQQGMNPGKRQARRYHWRSASVRSFVEEPHNAVVGPNQGRIVNLTDRRSLDARQAAVSLVQAGPDPVLRELRAVAGNRHLSMPNHHAVRPTDVFLRRLHGVIAAAQDAGTRDFESLLLTEGLGPRTMQSLALLAEVVCGAPSRFDDPARFAFAHGGKDGHPHPVPLKVYDESISALRFAVSQARVGRTDKLDAIRRLEQQVRRLEQAARGPALDAIIDQAWESSADQGGMTVFGPAGERVRKRVRAGPGPKRHRQLKLFA